MFGDEDVQKGDLCEALYSGLTNTDWLRLLDHMNVNLESSRRDAAHTLVASINEGDVSNYQLYQLTGEIVEVYESIGSLEQLIAIVAQHFPLVAHLYFSIPYWRTLPLYNNDVGRAWMLDKESLKQLCKVLAFQDESLVDLQFVDVETEVANGDEREFERKIRSYCEERDATQILFNTLNTSFDDKAHTVRNILTAQAMESDVRSSESVHWLEKVEFVSWLQEHYPDLDILNAEPKNIDTLAEQFCEEKNYDNAQTLISRLWWLRVEPTNGNISWFKRIADIIKPIISSRDKSGKLLIERYKATDFHAMLFFDEAKQLRSLLKQYGSRITSLSSDTLELYYSTDDIKKNAIAFDVLRELRSLYLEPDQIPALVIWQEVLAAAEVIQLEGLQDKDIYNLLKSIVTWMQQQKQLDQIKRLALDWREKQLQHCSTFILQRSHPDANSSNGNYVDGTQNNIQGNQYNATGDINIYQNPRLPMDTEKAEDTWKPLLKGKKLKLIWKAYADDPCILHEVGHDKLGSHQWGEIAKPSYGPSYLVFGPYDPPIKCSAGRYKAAFELMIDDAEAADVKVAEIDVAIWRGNKKLADKELMRSHFTKAHKPHVFVLDFELDHVVHDLELRIEFYYKARLIARQLELYEVLQ